jgi:hypothetical protein
MGSRICIATIAAAATVLTACGAQKPVRDDGLSACLGGQTGMASTRRSEAVFQSVARQASSFIATFELDSNADESFKDAVRTELYLMPDEASAKRAQTTMNRQLKQPDRANLVERRRNLLLVYAQHPSLSQMATLDACLKPQHAGAAGPRLTLWTKAKAAAYARRQRAKRLAAVRSDPSLHYRTTMYAMVQNCLIGATQSGWPARWFGTALDDSSVEDPLWEEDRQQAFDIRPWDPQVDQVPGNAGKLPAAPRVEIVFAHRRFSGSSASEYIRQAKQQQEADSGFTSVRLQFLPLAGDQGVLVFNPREHAPTKPQIADARQCYQEAAARFQDMLSGKRDLDNVSR